MHDLNSEIWPDARADFCWMRARARAAYRQPAQLLISRSLWLLNARPVAKTDALIVFLSCGRLGDHWVPECADILFTRAYATQATFT